MTSIYINILIQVTMSWNYIYVTRTNYYAIEKKFRKYVSFYENV